MISLTPYQPDLTQDQLSKVEVDKLPTFHFMSVTTQARRVNSRVFSSAVSR
jgi:hypothetical protein